MILILSGTRDGRELVERLKPLGYPLLVSTATTYGGQLIDKKEEVYVHSGRLDIEEMVQLIRAKGIKILVDATHPYAQEASINGMKACELLNIPYFRYERKPMGLEGTSLGVHIVKTYEEAAVYLQKTKGNILLTVGSKNLEIFVKHLELDRLFVRVLPASEIIRTCENYGLKPNQIIAMQGPFSTQMNMAILKKYEIQMMVSKDSGEVGGMFSKLEAAETMDIPIVLIDRPRIQYRNSYENMDELIKKVSEQYA